jgi:hypothetical protein
MIVTAIRIRAQGASRIGARFWRMNGGRAGDAFHNRTWHWNMPSPLAQLAAGVSCQDEGRWEAARGERIAEAQKRTDNQGTTVRHDSAP